jgi:predicted RecB family nuclease
MKKMIIKPVVSMESLIKSLEEFELIAELTKKFINSEVTTQMLVHKKTEESIIIKLFDAPVYHLKALKNNYLFHYYEKELIGKLIDVILTKRKNNNG